MGLGATAPLTTISSWEPCGLTIKHVVNRLNGLWVLQWLGGWRVSRFIECMVIHRNMPWFAKFFDGLEDMCKCWNLGSP